MTTKEPEPPTIEIHERPKINNNEINENAERFRDRNKTMINDILRRLSEAAVA
jgi:hypothetical protein